MLYKLSRFSKLHNILRVVANNILWKIPNGIKYPIAAMTRKIRFPYCLLKEGDMVIQVGAPWDLLHAGRSRTIHFSRFVGETGRVLVFEPDPLNIEKLTEFLKKNNISNVTIVPKGAWNKTVQLRFLSDKAHPASNLVEEVYDDSRTDLDKYDVIAIDATSIDEIVSEMKFDSIKLLSLTSNGSEQEILEGAEKACAKVEYISIIGDKSKYPKIDEYDFEYLREDDRGYLYQNSK